MPTPCWLKHLCSIRALTPNLSFFLLSLSLSVSISLFLADSLDCESWLRNQGILDSFLLSLSHRRLQTTRFQSNKGSTKEESEKAGLKLNIQKTKNMASGPITSWQIDGETVETVTDFTFLAPKSLQMVTAAMKLKDVCSLEEKLWQM